MNCDFCKKEFSSKGNLTNHQKTAKYCLELQGINASNLKCDFCIKSFTCQKNLNEHLQTCKEKQKKDYVKEFEKEIKRLRDDNKKQTKHIEELNKNHIKKMSEKESEYTKHINEINEEKDSYHADKLSETKQHYEEKIADIIAEKDKQIAKLEEMLKVKDKAIMDIAFAKTKILTQHNTNNNIVVNNNYCINLKDVDKLNQVIEERMNKNVIQGGIHGFTNMIKQHYLSSPEGQLGYKCVDISRQKFEYTDENGEKREDYKADELRQTLAVSNLEQKTRRTAAEAWTKEDGSLDGDMFEKLAVKAHEIIAITEVGDCNTKFRSELAVQVCKK